VTSHLGKMSAAMRSVGPPDILERQPSSFHRDGLGAPDAGGIIGCETKTRLLALQHEAKCAWIRVRLPTDCRASLYYISRYYVLFGAYFSSKYHGRNRHMVHRIVGPSWLPALPAFSKFMSMPILSPSRCVTLNSTGDGMLGLPVQKGTDIMPYSIQCRQ
jgi:hypothetical protein